MTSVLTPAPIIALEDDRDDYDLLRLLMKKAGCLSPLRVYRDGEKLKSALARALKSAAEAIRPALCLIDLKVPNFTGHEVLRWMRAETAFDRVPIVVLSASEHPRDIQQAAQEGANCYLAKYPHPRVLQHVLSDAERFAAGEPAGECFCAPWNLLLVRCRRVDGTVAPARL